MPDPIPQTVPISELRRQQDKFLKMAEAAPVVLMSRSEPAGVLVSPQEWNQIVNRLRQLEALQEALLNIAQHDANQVGFPAPRCAKDAKQRRRCGKSGTVLKPRTT